jgi:tetratricopeptide (TPR) repeat protein
VRLARCVVVACLAGCGVRTPAAIDVAALVRARGPTEARRELVIRVTSEPRDVAARLGLAALADQLGRPGEAIEQLEAVVALGGPLGIRWHAADRARLARLIAARGRVRLARGAASARADLERARGLGAAITDAELRAARAAAAIAELRHSDAETRARGREALAELATSAPAAAPDAADVRAAAPAWRGAAASARADERGRFGAWLWTVGARRAAWDELSTWHAAAGAAPDPALQQAYVVALRWWTPVDRWGSVAELGAPDGRRADPPASASPAVPPVASPASASPAVPPAPASPASASPASASPASASPASPASPAPPAELEELPAAYRRDPAIADRLARDAVAAAPDAAAMHAAVGAQLDALGDPARARRAWQAAVDASPEPAFLRGLAEAQARQGDADAALVTATAAAAASGDPAVVWSAVARALVGAGRYAHALEAARSAIDLADADTLGGALDSAIAASRALGRTEQADRLQDQRTQLLGSSPDEPARARPPE